MASRATGPRQRSTADSTEPRGFYAGCTQSARCACIQDPIEYFIRTHHTYVDTFERLILDDLKQAAVVVAYTVYHLAMRDEMVPRKPGTAATR